MTRVGCTRALELARADAEAKERRVGASRDEWVVEKGQIVTHIEGCRKFRVVEVEDLDEDSWYVGGDPLQVEELDTEEKGEDDAESLSSDSGIPYFTDEVVVEEGHGTRASFCESCSVYFDEDFVTRTSHDDAPRIFYKVEDLRFRRCHSMCDRCLVHLPQERILWRLLAARVRARSIVQFWFKQIFKPAYLPRLEREMREAVQM